MEVGLKCERIFEQQNSLWNNFGDEPIDKNKKKREKFQCYEWLFWTGFCSKIVSWFHFHLFNWRFVDSVFEWIQEAEDMQVSNHFEGLNSRFFFHLWFNKCCWWMAGRNGIFFHLFFIRTVTGKNEFQFETEW